MDQVVGMFQEGGLGMYVLLALDLALFPFSGMIFLVAVASRWAQSARLPAKVLSLLQLGAGLFVGGVGLAAWLWARHEVDQVLPMVDPAMVDALREAGYAEAAHSLKFGGVSALFLVLPAIVSFVVAGGLEAPTAPGDQGGGASEDRT